MKVISEQYTDNQIKCITKNLKDLKNRRGLNEIDKETYELTAEHLNFSIEDLKKEINNKIPKISNLEKLLSVSLNKLQPQLLWGSSKFEEKIIFQKTLFPEGIFLMLKHMNI